MIVLVTSLAVEDVKVDANLVQMAVMAVAKVPVKVAVKQYAIVAVEVAQDALVAQVVVKVTVLLHVQMDVHMNAQVVQVAQAHVNNIVKVDVRGPVMVAHHVVDVLHVQILVRDVHHPVWEPVQTPVLICVAQVVKIIVMEHVKINVHPALAVQHALAAQVSV